MQTPSADTTRAERFIKDVHILLKGRQHEHGDNPAPTLTPIQVTSAPSDQNTQRAHEHARVLCSIRVMNQYVTNLVRIASRPESISRNIGDKSLLPSALFSVLPLSTVIQQYHPHNETVRLFNQVIMSPCTDRESIRALLALSPGQKMEYDVDVCDLTLRGRTSLLGARGYIAWRREAQQWKNSGMLYPLAVAARHASNTSQWLTPEQTDTQVGKAFERVLHAINVNGQITSRQVTAAIEQLADSWHATDPSSVSARDELIRKLDDACIRMQIKSNGLPGTPMGFDLRHSLGAFAQAHPNHTATTKAKADARAHTDSRTTWPRLCERVQAAFPPSLLYSGLSQHRDATWGFEKLTLRTTPIRSDTDIFPNAALHFSLCALSCIHPKARTDQPWSRPARLPDTLARLGAIALSPHVASVMLPAPTSKEAHLDTNGPQSVLQLMRTHDPADHTEYHKKVIQLEAEASSPNALAAPSSEPQTYVMWRVDLPCVGLSHEDDPPDGSHLHSMSSTVHIRKQAVPLKHKQEAVSDAGVVPMSSNVDEEGIRRLVTQHFANNLETHPAHTVVTRGEETNLCTVALAEALVCLTKRPLEGVITTCPVGAQTQWSGDGIEPRYMTVETASNGRRARDWAAVHVDTKESHTWQARLASHVVTTSSMHLTTMGWIDPEGSTKTVHVQSTLPLEHRVIRGNSLGEAVENCYRRDTGLLPTRHVDTGVDRKSVEAYHPSPHLTLMAYAPMEANSTFELIVFQLEPDTHT